MCVARTSQIARGMFLGPGPSSPFNCYLSCGRCCLIWSLYRHATRLISQKSEAFGNKRPLCHRVLWKKTLKDLINWKKALQRLQMIQTIWKVNEESPSFKTDQAHRFGIGMCRLLTEIRGDETGRKPPRRELYSGPFAAVPLNRWL